MLEKVIIRAFANNNLTGPQVGDFVLPINPENMTRNFKIERDNSQAGGNQHNSSKYDKTKSEDLKFDFILDNTNTVENYYYGGIPVPTQIGSFLSVAYDLKSDTHQPNKVKIIWGKDFVFDCVLESLNITYNLFSLSGEVLRAKLSVSFTGFVSNEKRVRIEGKLDGALTKVVPLLSEERITDVTQKVYQNKNLFMQVAKINNIVNFRGLIPGNNLTLPPIEKVIEQAENINKVIGNTQNLLNGLL
jgi:hypothetical protein